jgi:2,3-bisphosphoglycerate-independent phosphoglycerate mutase
VTLEGDVYESSTLESYNASDIETEEAAPLSKRLNREVFQPPFKLYHVDTFRNILVVEGAGALAGQLKFMPAHDMIGGTVSDYTNGDSVMQQYFTLMRRAYEALKENNDTLANGIWFWGASSAPDFGPPPSDQRVILAETSLMRGIAALAGFNCVTLPEDNGFVTFLKEKTKAALKAMEEYDYAYIHIQKLDDLSHELQPVEKMQAIEQIDEHFIRPFFAQIREPYSAFIVSDHYTFSDSGGHGADPAPFMLLGHGSAGASGRFTEQHCRNADLTVTAAELVTRQRGGQGGA